MSYGWTKGPARHREIRWWYDVSKNVSKKQKL